MADNTPKIPKDSTKEIGASGTVIYSGIITNEDYNTNLTGIQAIRQYEIMRRSDSTIRSALQVVKLPILSTTWSVKPAQGEDGEITDVAQKKADFISHELFNHNVNFHDTLRQALTMFDFGFSVFEKVYEPTTYDGQNLIGLAKLGSRKQFSIQYWQTPDKQPGITQYLIGNSQIGTGQVGIPREKLIYFSHDREGDNYAGTSLLRYVYKDWDMKDKLTLVNAMALEKMGMGVPVITAKDGQTPTATDQDNAKDALASMRANNQSYLSIPNTMTVEMMDMKASTTKEIIPTLNYHDSRIMKSILAGFLELGGHSGSGSQSLSKDLTSLFMKSEEAAANVIVSALQTDLIKQMCDLNWTDMSEGYPEITYGTIADDDVDTLATALNALTTAGLITPDAEVENHLRQIYRIPEMTKDQIDNYEPPVPKTAPAPAPVEPATPPATNKPDVKASLDGARKYRAALIGMLAEG